MNVKKDDARKPGPASDEVRAAIMAQVEARRSDPEFRERLTKIIERDREILDHLRDKPSTHERTMRRWRQEGFVNAVRIRGDTREPSPEELERMQRQSGKSGDGYTALLQ